MTDVIVYKGDTRIQLPCRNIDPELPKLPFVWLIIGVRGAGKSQVVANIMGNWYRNCFHKIYFYSPTRFQTTYQNFEFNPDRVFEEYSDLQFLTDVFPNIESDSEKGMRSLIVFDDMIGRTGISGNTPTKMINFILNSRHYHTSVLIASQSYKAINRAIRINANVLSFFRVNNKSEKNKIVEELDDDLEKHLDEMNDWEPYDFLTLDLQVAPSDKKRYRRNFKSIS